MYIFLFFACSSTEPNPASKNTLNSDTIKEKHHEKHQEKQEENKEEKQEKIIVEASETTKTSTDEEASIDVNGFRFPSDSALQDHPDKDRITRGKEILLYTKKELPEYVGANMNCSNCHLQAGTIPTAMPFVGVRDRYPKYRDRSGKVDDLAERVNGCFERSMNGKILPTDSEDMKSILAYMNWISSEVEDGKQLKEAGLQKLSPLEPNPENGKNLYTIKCASCHQLTGQGISAGDVIVYPPLWGENSYNIGAGMARLHKAAAFIKWNMPLGQGGSLTDQEAYDIASYFIYQDRPDLAKKGGDWPKGNKPTDARY